MGLIDKLRAKAQETLQDPQKMATIQSKVSGMVSRRLAGRSGGGGYYPNMGPGMAGYGYDNNPVGDNESPADAPYIDDGSAASGDWSDSGMSGSDEQMPNAGGGDDSAGSWDSGGSSDSSGDSSGW